MTCSLCSKPFVMRLESNMLHPRYTLQPDCKHPRKAGERRARVMHSAIDDSIIGAEIDVLDVDAANAEHELERQAQRRAHLGVIQGGRS